VGIAGCGCNVVVDRSWDKGTSLAPQPGDVVKGPQGRTSKQLLVCWSDPGLLRPHCNLPDTPRRPHHMCDPPLQQPQVNLCDREDQMRRVYEG